MLTSLGPVNAVLNVATQVRRGVTDDSSRISRMITGTLNEYPVERGWLPKDKRYPAKRLGKYQIVHEQYLP